VTAGVIDAQSANPGSVFGASMLAAITQGTILILSHALTG
jgi:hypothetical protein